ncbi:hypothetical protein BCR43DRAFT_498941 [Syncephalastrum racemosum]|uniref:Uncharacterized protein n=1 Tax=Syncephalastrum racemosum TaxID=13706 RepID=A0A1X2H1Q9_SYNRA|nr:hypothetical protein BCR43DRAFT_498941 [Syncephalastrum racemosum]
MRYFFLEFYTGDGIFGATYVNRFAMVLKACEFVPLYKMLARCGVATPHLRFRKLNYVSVRHNAGHVGSVAWVSKCSPGGSSAISDLGLPSSHTVSSDPDLLKSAIAHTDAEGKIEYFLLLILGYMVADGTLVWRYHRSMKTITIRYGGIQLFSTDLGFLQWAYKELLSAGMDDIGVYVAKRQESSERPHTKASKARNVYGTYIRNTTRNNNTLKRGLDLMSDNDIPLDGKLEFLSDFLQNSGSLPTTVLQPKELSFHDYVGENINDPVGCVIAQHLTDGRGIPKHEIRKHIRLQCGIIFRPRRES